MRNFIYIRPLGLGADILVGLAQIASVEPVQRKRRGPYYAELHLGDGRIVAAEETWERVLDDIEAASGDPPPEPDAETAPTPDPVAPNGPPAIAASAQQAEVKKEYKKRGRPPKAT